MRLLRRKKSCKLVRTPGSTAFARSRLIRRLFSTFACSRLIRCFCLILLRINYNTIFQNHFHTAVICRLDRLNRYRITSCFNRCFCTFIVKNFRLYRKRFIILTNYFVACRMSLTVIGVLRLCKTNLRFCLCNDYCILYGYRCNCIIPIRLDNYHNLVMSSLCRNFLTAIVSNLQLISTLLQTGNYAVCRMLPSIICYLERNHTNTCCLDR